MAESEPRMRADPLAPRFRIMRRGAWRRAFRLEEVFWDALEREADARGLKLTDHVREIVEGETGSSSAARLRAHVAAYLSLQLAEADKRFARFGAHYLLQASPAAGFVISREAALLAYNPAFLAFVRAVASSSAEQAPASGLPQARLTLDAPIAGVLEALAGAYPRALETGFVLRTRDHAVRGRVRVCLAPGEDRASNILGFITEQERPGTRR